MEKSETIEALAKALVAANKGVKNPQKNAVNPHFKNRYATLDAIIEAYKTSYLENGISVIENPCGQDGKVGVEITLLHESGQYITHNPFMLPPGKNDAQGHGSSITYARRYALSAVMNIAADEDDDGEGAKQTKQPYKAPPKPDGMVTPKQKQMIAAKTRALSTKLGIEQLDVYKAAQSKLSITKSTGDLTADEASKVIGYLIEQEG